MQADVKISSMAVNTMLKLCRNYETLVITAGRVGKVSAKVKSSAMLLEDLLTQHGKKVHATLPADAAVALKSAERQGALESQ
jgi:hypothetical protein